MGRDAHPFSERKCESYAVRRSKKLPGRQFLDKNQLGNFVLLQFWQYEIGRYRLTENMFCDDVVYMTALITVHDEIPGLSGF